MIFNKKLNYELLEDRLFVKDYPLSPLLSEKIPHVQTSAISPEMIFSCGDGTADNPYQIQTEQQLRMFARSLSENFHYQNIYLQLSNDILLSDEDWVPIGEGHYPFCGHFDGQGYHISNLRIGTNAIPYVDFTGTTATGYFGLFGVLENFASVRNLYLDAAIHAVSGQSLYIGSLAGYAGQATITNVSVTCTLHGYTHHDKANIFVGGICGNGYRQTITNCTCKGDITAETFGGMAEAGGIIGFHNRGFVDNCFSSGTIQGFANTNKTGRTVLGGIAGVHAGTITNCSTVMQITNPHSKNYTGAIAGWATGISFSSHCGYCISENGKNTDQLHLHPFGFQTKKGENRIGQSYAGSIIHHIIGFDFETLQEHLQKRQMTFAL